MRLALGQINPTVGDFAGNQALLLDVARRAKDAGAEVVAFPELALNGYPPRDLVEVPAFLHATEQALDQLACESAALGLDMIVGFVGREQRQDSHLAANCAAVLRCGHVVFTQQKMLLPTYDVFDEVRYFAPAKSQQPFELAGLRVGITICEDVWNDKQFWPRPRYDRDPVQELVEAGVDLILNISSSPYHKGKRAFREQMLSAAAQRNRIPIAMVNQLGGNDQLLFDGSSFVVNAAGQTVARAASFRDDLLLFDTQPPLSLSSRGTTTKSPASTTLWRWACATTCANAASAARLSASAAASILRSPPRSRLTPWARKTSSGSGCPGPILRPAALTMPRPWPKTSASASS